MRATGKLLVLLGIVSLLVGGYGFILMHTSGSPEITGWAAETFVHIGGLRFSLAYPQFILRGFQAFTITFRMGLSLGGLAALILGGLMMKHQNVN